VLGAERASVIERCVADVDHDAHAIGQLVENLLSAAG
jgi:hypothetical protein